MKSFKTKMKFILALFCFLFETSQASSLGCQLVKQAFSAKGLASSNLPAHPQKGKICC